MLGECIVYQSSFTYHDFFGGNTLLVIVPHQDDEMNMAGAAIYGALHEGMTVYCAYFTDGDYEYPAWLRRREAEHMAVRIGLPKENLCYLGFPDRGHELGIYKITEAIEAMETLLLKIQPDAVIATDCDTHPDHKICSEAFDQAIQNLSSRGALLPTMRVFKGFAYATGYETVDDFNALNLKSTKINRQLLSEGCTTENPDLEWVDRIRIPVPEDCRSLDLIHNPVFSGMSAHESQRAYKRGRRLINGDNVLWQVSLRRYKETYKANTYKYCHILAGNEFMYDWILCPGETVPVINAYVSNAGIDAKALRWKINDRVIASEKVQPEITGQLTKEAIRIRLEIAGTDAFCEVTLRKGTYKDLFYRWYVRLRNWWNYQRVRQEYKRAWRTVQAYRK